ncbi:MAG: NAD(+) diphosphatase [Limibacillus sp.]
MTIRNFYSQGGLEREEPLRRDPQWLDKIGDGEEVRVVAGWRYRNLVASLENPTEFADLRQVGPVLERWEGSVLAYARGLAWWHARHRFCGVCGHPTRMEMAGHQRRCENPECGASHFPRTDPAVIMLVHDGGDRCVLGRQAAWPEGRHSTLAGFVEPGESLEEAVAREVLEEVGIRVRDVTYHSSQPWPFPSSIMLGFHARADYGPLTVDPNELESAQWFERKAILESPGDALFQLPREDSIARQLILSWLEEA